MPFHWDMKRHFLALFQALEVLHKGMQSSNFPFLSFKAPKCADICLSPSLEDSVPPVPNLRPHHPPHLKFRLK